MSEAMREALRRLALGRATMRSRQGRGAWTDGRALYTFDTVLAVPLADGSWLSHDRLFYSRFSRQHQADVHAHLRHLGVVIHRTVPPLGQCRTLSEFVRVAGFDHIGPRGTTMPTSTPAAPSTAPLRTAAEVAGTPFAVPRLGFELEVEFSGSRGQQADYAEVCAALSNGHVTSDGSLYCGWEFKSGTPLTLAQWRAQPLGAALATLQARDAVESHERAGLHIHVDRASFSPEGLARLFTVVNHTDNALHAFSRRGPSTSYCRFVPQSLEAWRSAMRSAGKYSAAFLHTGYPTVELRLFRSTVLLHRLLAALECAEALWRFAMHSTLPPTGADWAHWVAEQPDYVLLTCELRAQGVLPAVAPVYAAAQPLSKPVPPPPPVVRATPAPTPSARVEVGTSPSGSTYYWEPATQRVVYRERGTGTYQPTSLGWQTSQGEVSTWIRTQLQNRGLWTPPAPPAPEAYDLGRDPESIVPYRFHLATQRVQYGASGAWADSDYHRQSEFADTHEGRSRRWAWITAQLARHGVTLTVPSAPAVEAGV